MSDKFQINYNNVYTKTAGLRARIESELAEMENTYRQTQNELHGMDGKTNAALMDAMERNQIKAKTTAETLHRLLAFIELSSRHVEQDELKLKSMYSMARSGGLRKAVMGTEETTQGGAN
ncbi:MAG: hypothetical protein FWE34_08195 [Defluviitaleaceae bacterium]|nr:hypothetical protein [Defluviitaleaceae bacterium]